MNKFHLFTTLFCLLLTTSAFSQLKFNLKAMPDANTYGVYLRPCGVNPSANTITGTGQVTVILPIGNNASNLKSIGGAWSESGTISGPVEAPNNNYFSFGFLADSPQIVFEAGKETLLLTFVVEGPGIPTLMDNDTDPFAVFPNSTNTNPGNEMSTLDVGITPVGYYFYSGHYTDDDPTSCEDSSTTNNDDGDDDDDDDTTTSVLEEVNDHAYFSLSPNPTSHQVNINFSQTDNRNEGMVRLWTSTGINLENQTSNGRDKLSMNVDDLPNGFYFISYEVAGEVLQRERFMKQ